MGRLSERFRALRERGEAALIPFVTAGDPDLEVTEALVLAIAEAGADAIELGVPFSDPMAEGPTIQRASERALASGTSLRRVLGLVARLRARIETPLVLMGYANNMLRMGASGFAEAGVDGLITVDLPPEEGEDFYRGLRKAGVDPVLLAAPTTRRDRLEMLAKETRGFLYFVALTGVTGARESISTTLEPEVRALRALDRPSRPGRFPASTRDRRNRRSSSSSSCRSAEVCRFRRRPRSRPPSLPSRVPGA